MLRQALIFILLAAVPLSAQAQEKNAPEASAKADRPAKTDKGKKAKKKADEAAPADKPVEYNEVALQGLNKVTGHISRIEGPVGTVLTFGQLEIIARRCWKASPEERPENAALLEIRELHDDEGPQRIFLGWMFSSSPGLSGLEHPVYDINVLSCDTHKEGEKKEEPAESDGQDDDKANADKKEPEKKPASKPVSGR